MSWATVIVARVRGLLGRRRLERELDEEIEFHLEMQMEDNLRAGMDAEQARCEARRSFGAVEGVKEVYRERSTLALVETTARDVRYAARTLWKSPGFTLTAVTVLALAIGASTAMVSVLDAVLFRPLPYERPDELTMLWTVDPVQDLREGRSALWDVEQWRAQSESFVDMATFDSFSRTLLGRDGAERIAGASISANLLPLLGVQPILGRGFSRLEAEESRPLVLVSHAFGQERFGGAREALGATLVLDGVAHEIIGVLPEGFQVAGLRASIWESHAGRQALRGGASWFVVGRLGPGVTIERARAEMGAIAQRLSERMPVSERNRDIGVVSLSQYLVGAPSRLALWILAGSVLLVFLIAAANVTSLSLARSVARTREMAVRASLGASPGRIVRQLLTENVLLATVAGSIGALLAAGGIRLVRSFGPANLPRLHEVSVDPQMLGWALAVSLLAGVLVGVAPAMVTLRRDLRPSGEEGGRSVSGGTATREIRRALVVAEFGLAIVLLAGAGLLVRSWWHVAHIDSGFRPERTLMMEISAPTTLQATTEDGAAAVFARRIDLYRRVLEEVRAVPGVESVGMTGDLFIDNNRVQDIVVERDAGVLAERLQLVGAEVTADFFRAMGTPLLHGRFFTPQDGPDTVRVAIINQAMAQRAWPGEDAVGKRFKMGSFDSERPWHVVVGVTADMRRQGPEREVFPQMFVPFEQVPPQSADLLIRTTADDPSTMADDLMAAVRRAERNAPIYGVAPLEQRLGGYLAERRFQTSLLTGFSMVALLIAAVGIYGLIQYSITTRTQEIGIRMAVGAPAGEIFRMILGEGLKLSLTGLLLGLGGALWLGRAASRLLHGVNAHDPLTFAAVSLILVGVAVVACLLPARRAMRIQPILALRRE